MWKAKSNSSPVASPSRTQSKEWTPGRSDQSASSTERSIGIRQTSSNEGTHVHNGMDARRIIGSSLSGVDNPNDFTVGATRIITGTTAIGVGTTAVDTNIPFLTSGAAAFKGQPIVLCSVIDPAAVASGVLRTYWGDISGGVLGIGTADGKGFWFGAVRASGSTTIRVMWQAIGLTA